MEISAFLPKRFATKRLPFEEIRIMPIGDIQFDGLPDSACDIDRLARHLKWGVDNDVLFVGMGDYTDFASPSNRQRLKSAGLYDTTERIIEQAAESGLEKLKEIMEPTKGRWLGLLEGHHYYEFCLDEGVQALTKDGWRSYKEVFPGQDILVYDKETSRLAWRPVQALHVYNGDRWLWDCGVAFATASHRWYGVRQHYSSNRHQYRDHVFGEVASPLHIPRIIGRPAPGRHGPHNVPDWLVALAAWVVTDGMLVARRNKRTAEVRIFQHPDKAPIIRQWLAQSAAKYSEHLRRNQPLVVFSIWGHVARQLRSVMDDRKRLQMPWLRRLSHEQVLLLFDQACLGDGHGDVLYQKDYERIVPFSQILTERGIPTRLWQTSRLWACRTYRSRWDIVFLPKPAFYSGTVWCPQVSTGYWVARSGRTGEVFVTGNSDGTTTDMQLARFLGAPFLGTCTMIRLTFDRRSGGGRGTGGGSTCVIWAHHGVGGGVTTAAPINKLERIAAHFEADIYLMAHQHKAVSALLDRLYITAKGPPLLIDRTKALVATGSFLRGYMQGSQTRVGRPKGTYVEQRLLMPVALGGPLITITPRHREHYDDIDIRVSV